MEHSAGNYDMPMDGTDMNNGPREMPDGAMDANQSHQEMPQAGMSTTGDDGGETGGEMPSGDMGSTSTGDGSPPSDDMPVGDAEDGTQRVLVELRVPTDRDASAALQMASAQAIPSFQLDQDYDPVPIGPTAGEARALADSGEEAEETVIIRGTVETSRIPELEAQANVVHVWLDTPIAPFPQVAPPVLEEMEMQPTAPTGPCPIPPCDCTFGNPANGNIAGVANYLGVNQIWNAGYKGDGIVIGIVDGGIRATGKPTSESGPKIARVIGGWPSNWGTTANNWGDHGNMTATDALGMAPNAQIYDIRISDAGTSPGTISDALQGFQWAINKHEADGTPHVLSNSWGIFHKSWDPTYADNPNHPFTRKVEDALNEGILVLFAAGNCGQTCPDGRCGSSNGPGKSIWGANGHPRVMTVGAVNLDEKWVGYSSQGPAALDPNKPDFCGITHFAGYFPTISSAGASDGGTSAATPIVAGVVALLKQVDPSLTQNQAKSSLKTTAKDIGPTGFDQHSGAGIVRAKSAYDRVVASPSSSGPAVSWGANRLDAFVIGTNSALYHKWWNGSAWGPSVTGYEHMGGRIISDPEVVAWGPNRLDVFVLGTNSALYHKWWNGSAWGPSITGYEYMGGRIISQPKTVAWGSNRLDVFVLGTNSALYHKWWNGSAWGPSITGYEHMGGRIISDPEVVSWGPNRLDVFVLGTNSALYHKWWNGSAWGPSVTGYEHMGGRIIGHPKAVAWGANRLDVFVRGTNSALYHKWWNGSAWGPSVTGYESLGGTIISDPEVVSWGPNRLDIFAIGTDSALYHKWWNGSSWGPSKTGWQNLGGRIIGQPRVVSWGPNRLDIFVRGMDSALYHKWWNGSSWGPSVTGWQDMGGTIIRF